MTLNVVDKDTLEFITSEFITANINNISKLELTYSYGCGSSTTIDFTSSKNTMVDLYAENLGITLEADDFYDTESEKFCEGVYYFEWKIEYYVGEVLTYYNESVCGFVDGDNVIKCKVRDYYLETEDPRPIYILEAMTYSTQCDNCNCTVLCDLYNDLLLTINESTNGSSDCGCK